MAQIPSALGSTSTDQPFGAHNTLNDLNLDTFLKLMISELQNQDPLNPMDNTQMLSQINEMRQIGATDKLTSTLNSVLLGQNISSSTNLIGSNVIAVSDDGQPVSGIVSRVSIEDGDPKLHLDKTLGAEGSLDKGDLAAGEYSYRVTWTNADGKLEGVEFSGDDAVSTVGEAGTTYESIVLSNLPITAGEKRVYRTDSSGEGDYRLVGTIADGKQANFRDKIADTARSETRQTQPFTTDPRSLQRTFKVSLNNVSEIREAAGT